MNLVAGEALIDLFIGTAGAAAFPAETTTGGSPFNVAIGVGQLGRPSAFLSTFSEDVFSTFLAQKPAESGVSAEYLQRCPNYTTLSVVATDALGQPRYSFYALNSADRALAPQALPAELPADGNSIAASSYASGVEPISSAIETLLRREAGSRVISLDPNVRPRVVGDLDAYRERSEPLLAYADIVKASDEDIELLYGSHDLASVARACLQRGPKLAITTRGEKRPLADVGGNILERSAPKIDVVDTVGAGDTFHAGLLAWLDANNLLTPKKVTGLNDTQVTAALDLPPRQPPSSAPAAAPIRPPGARSNKSWPPAPNCNGTDHDEVPACPSSSRLKLALKAVSSGMAVQAGQ